jgi:hypothetical protein
VSAVAGCSGCPATWRGLRMAHCSSCHVTFSSPGGFDRHRSAGCCVLPQSLGMRQLHRGGGEVWGVPMPDDVRSRVRRGP